MKKLYLLLALLIILGSLIALPGEVGPVPKVVLNTVRLLLTASEESV